MNANLPSGFFLNNFPIKKFKKLLMIALAKNATVELSKINHVPPIIVLNAL